MLSCNFLIIGEDYEVDPQIPDVSEWEPIQIRDFFSEKGFSDALSNVFLQQVRNASSPFFTESVTKFCFFLIFRKSMDVPCFCYIAAMWFLVSA